MHEYSLAHGAWLFARLALVLALTFLLYWGIFQVPGVKEAVQLARMCDEARAMHGASAYYHPHYARWDHEVYAGVQILGAGALLLACVAVQWAEDHAEYLLTRYVPRWVWRALEAVVKYLNTPIW